MSYSYSSMMHGGALRPTLSHMILLSFMVPVQQPALAPSRSLQPDPPQVPNEALRQWKPRLESTPSHVS